MNQQRIKELLIEASSPDCPPERLNAIASALTDAIPLDAGLEIEDAHRDTMETYIGALFFNTVKGRRELLPSLLPAFALICGDSDPNSWLATVDFSLTK